MSYCQIQSGGMANLSVTFGTGHPWGIEPGRIPSRMNDHVVAQAAANPGCLDLVGDPGDPPDPPDPVDVIFGDGFESGDAAAWSTAQN